MNQPTTTRPRNIPAVAARVLALVPDDQTRLAQDLLAAIRAIEFHAPEQAGEDAAVVGQALWRNLGAMGDPRPGWAEAVLSVWRGEDGVEGDHQP